MSDLEHTPYEKPCHYEYEHELEVQRVNSPNFEDLIKQIDNLTPDQKKQVAQRLLGQSGLTVAFGNNNVVNSSFAIQLGGRETDDLAQQLKDCPPEIIEELLKAISIRIAQDRR
ncbi:hypothetical protein PN462_21165 [Spirulina sp. CS-785/01]|uniref:hypothetical protein n=1 Tax=Spirulina sp. CS-785/01 TaxID=3021716 RepID=UPI00232B35B3|nr:hypothetical protein [Spirulina sp. CS-785/01]MDB9315637.1 hypothetical protein [Spirulina sp. CS-785/01]